MKQLGLGLKLSTRKTRKRECLEQMEHMVPWSALVQIVAPHYPKARTGRQRWSRLCEHRTGFDKWSPAGLTSVQSCPRRRAGVACDERTTDAVGNSRSPLMLPV